jgi:hypothetical protein
MLGMEPNDKLDRLAQEVAALRAQLTELRQFFSIERSEQFAGHPKALTVRCAAIHLQDPADPSRTQGILSASNEGPCISLLGSDQKARVILRVEAAGPQCQLLGPDLQPAVELQADETSGRGQVGVFDSGKPRAVIKAAETGGIVSVVHDDNHARAMLHATADCGEFIAVNQDMQTAVKISSDGLSGGLVTVHGNNGKPGVVLSGAALGGLVMVNDTQGNLRASLPAND